MSRSRADSTAAVSFRCEVAVFCRGRSLAAEPLDRSTQVSSSRLTSKFLGWMDSRGYPAGARRAFPAALRSALDRLRERDAQQSVVLRQLIGQDRLALRHRSPDCWVYPTTRGCLAVGALAPDWKGQRAVTRNDEVGELLSDFLHFSEQYVARARALKITGAAALTFHRPLEFRFGSFSRCVVRGEDQAEHSCDEGNLLRHDPDVWAVTGRRAREFRAWVSALNTLDPMVHRAVFKYWRAVALGNHQFWEEAVTSLDGITAIAAEFVQRCKKLPQSPSRGAVGLHLEMVQDDQSQLERLYELRCAFGAHPSHAKWWDFSELYELELDDMFELSKRVIAKLCRLECRFRRVDPTPPSWSAWLLANADDLLNAVWFTRVP